MGEPFFPKGSEKEAEKWAIKHTEGGYPFPKLETDTEPKTLCLPTNGAIKLLKDGKQMPEVVAMLGEGAWQKVSVSEFGSLKPEDLAKIYDLAKNWGAVVQNYLVSLEDQHAAGGKGI